MTNFTLPPLNINEIRNIIHGLETLDKKCDANIKALEKSLKPEDEQMKYFFDKKKELDKQIKSTKTVLGNG